MIVPMMLSDIEAAAVVYSLSWVDSHQTICSEAVLQTYTAA